MKYKNGDRICIGDQVSLGGGWFGVVVCVVKDNQYSDQEPKKKWGYLGTGFVVLSPQASYVYYSEPDEEVVRIAGA